MSPAQLADWRSRNVGFVFQQLNLLPVLTAFQNVELPLLLTPLSKKERDERVRIALGVVGLGDRLQHYPRQLSGGQEQRVAIARAIVADPTLMLLDEPTGQLDAKSSQEVLGAAARLNDEFGKTMIVVTHDPQAAERAKTVLHLEKGTFVEQGRRGRWHEVLAAPAGQSRPAQAAHAAHHGERGAGAVPVRLAPHRHHHAQGRRRVRQRAPAGDHKRQRLHLPAAGGYANRLATVPGVEKVTWANWFGGQYGDGKRFFANFAVDAKILPRRSTPRCRFRRTRSRRSSRTARARSSARG